MRRTLVGFTLALGLAAGCSRSANPRTGPSSSQNYVSRQDILAIPVDNLYDALTRARPAFLRARSTGSRQEYPVVYVDGLRRGTIESLKVIPTREVNDVRYISAIDATTRFGMNVPAGVIEVRLLGR
jgi:hypothetical protein